MEEPAEGNYAYRSVASTRPLTTHYPPTQYLGLGRLDVFYELVASDLLQLL